MPRGNLQQAPMLKAVGDKFQRPDGLGKAIRNHSLEAAIANGLGERDFAAYKVMMFLTGNAEGFAVAEKTICERCNIGLVAYKNARKKLIELGWIQHNPGKEIVVNYNAIFQGYTENTSKDLGYTENTAKEDEGELGYTENTPQRYTENTPKGYTENTHNNIRNSIKKEDNKGTTANAGYTENTPKEVSIDEFKEMFFDRIAAGELNLNTLYTQGGVWVDDVFYKVRKE